MSALTKQRLNKLPELIETVSMNQNLRIPSALLNDVVMDAVAINPTPTDKGKRLKILCNTSGSQTTYICYFCQRRRTNALFLCPVLENQIRKAFTFEVHRLKSFRDAENSAFYHTF